MKERERENPKWPIQREKIWNLCETNETAMHREGKGVGWLISPEEETIIVNKYIDRYRWKFMAVSFKTGTYWKSHKYLSMKIE